MNTMVLIRSKIEQRPLASVAMVTGATTLKQRSFHTRHDLRRRPVLCLKALEGLLVGGVHNMQAGQKLLGRPPRLGADPKEPLSGIHGVGVDLHEGSAPCNKVLIVPSMVDAAPELL